VHSKFCGSAGQRRLLRAHFCRSHTEHELLRLSANFFEVHRVDHLCGVVTMVENERLAFMASWLDNVSGVSWTYQLMMYPQTSEVELFDVKNRRVFLRKTKLEGLKPEHFFVGGCCTVLGRQLKIVDYGDEYTRKTLSAVKQRCGCCQECLQHQNVCSQCCLCQGQPYKHLTSSRTLAIIKPDAVAHAGEIIQSIEKAGYLIRCVFVCVGEVLRLKCMPLALSNKILFAASYVCASFPRRRLELSIRFTERNHSSKTSQTSCRQVSKYMQIQLFFDTIAVPGACIATFVAVVAEPQSAAVGE
jgi:hypothetical protein